MESTLQPETMTFPIKQMLFKLPTFHKKRLYKRKSVVLKDWNTKNLIGVDTETSISFPKKLRTIQVYIAGLKLKILGTDEIDCYMEAIDQNINVYSIAEVKAFLEFIPLLGYKLIFYNAGFDLGQLGYSHFRKYYSLIDMKLWKTKVKRLSNGITYIEGFIPKKWLAMFFRIIGRYRYNPIIQQFFKRRFYDFMELVDAAYSIYTKENAYKYLRNKFNVKDFVLDVSTLAAVFHYRMSLKKLCEKLHIQIGKKDYDHTIDLHLQLKNILNHAKITVKCALRLFKMLFKTLRLKTNPCYILSPASLTKFVFSSLGLKRPIISKNEVLGDKWSLESLLQNTMASYFGGRVECKVKKKIVPEVHVSDFASLYPHVAMLMNLWDYMKAEELVITRNTRKATKIFKDASIEWLKDRENWKELPMLCQAYFGEKGALLPLRAEKRNGSMVVAQGVVKNSHGWYLLADLIASKIRGYDDIHIMEGFEYKKEGCQTLNVMEIGEGDSKTILDLQENDFFKVMLGLRFSYPADNPMYKLIKLVMNSAYGVTCERNKNEEYESPYREDRRKVLATPDKPLTEEQRTDKGGVYFNPFIGSNICAGGRLCLAIGEALSTTLVYLDSVTHDSPIFVKDKDETVDFIPVEDATTDLKVWSDKGWTPIKKIIKKPLQKRIFRVNTKSGVINVTEDHSLLNIKGEMVKPSDIEKGDLLLHKELPFNNTQVQYINEEMAWLLGLFLAEGSSNRYECPSGLKYQWKIDMQDIEILKEAGRILKTHFDQDWKILDIRESSAVYRLVSIKGVQKSSSKRMYEIFKPLCYSKKGLKKIPKVVLNSDTEIQKIFLEGYFTGDGHDKDNYNDKWQTCDSKDPCLIAGVIYLMKHLYNRDYNLFIRKDKPNITKAWFNSSKPRKTWNTLDPSIIKKVFEIQPYGEFVYDLETENHHFQAGVGCLIVHNTDSMFLENEAELKSIEKYFEPLIPLKREYSGSFFCLSEKRYCIFDYTEDNDVKIKVMKEHGLKNYVNVRTKDRMLALWRHLLNRETRWTEKQNNVKVEMNTEKLLKEPAIRKCSLYSEHFVRSLVNVHDYSPSRLKIGDFFFVSVSQDLKFEKIQIHGDDLNLKKYCQDNRLGRTLLDVINDFSIHDSGKIVNSAEGYGKFKTFEFKGLKIINKGGSIITQSRNDMLELFNNKICISPTVIQRFGFSSHKWGDDKTPPKKDSMFR